MREPPLIDLAGSPAEIGLGHGRALAAEIAACIDVYREVFDRPESAIADTAGHFARVIRGYAPHLAEEIEAIAAGAGQPVHWLYALNARSELVPFSAPECTAVLMPRARVLGQTWDWIERLQELVVVLRIDRGGEGRLLTVTEPGIVGKIGLSGAGLGVCLNFLAAPGRLDGVPVHIVLREILNASSFEAARQRVREAGAGKGGHVLLGSAGGEGVSYEFAGPEVIETPLADTPFAHTNHWLFADLPPGESRENSVARLRTAAALLAAEPDQDMARLRALLGDQSRPDNPICTPYRPLHGLSIGTVCTVLMDLAARRLAVRAGPRPQAGFRELAL